MDVDQNVCSWATISPDGHYRYELGRRWAEGSTVLWVMLNPSTADANHDDPTIRRCIDFSKAWGAGGLVVCNLFALRSSKPASLLGTDDPVGPDNQPTLQHNLADPAHRIVMAAWGQVNRRLLLPRPAVETLAGHAGRTLHCLGTTKSGAPRHPLHVHSSKLPEVYR